MMRKVNPWLAIAGLVAGSVLSFDVSATSYAKTAGYLPDITPDTPHVVATINNANLATLPSARVSSSVSQYDTGAMAPSESLSNVVLLLKRSSAKQQEFDAYLRELTRPGSPYFHHWLTRSQIGTMFGPAQSDIAQIKQWLSSQGLTVKKVTSDGMMISFSGSAGSVESAFHTQIHHFNVNGVQHFGSVGTQQIPAALSPVVQGVASLGNFFPKPMHIDAGTVHRNKQTGKWENVAQATGATPQFTVPPGTVNTQTSYDVAPADFNQIYNVNPLWNQTQAVRGAGQTIVVLERTDINLADVATFRQAFLPANATGTVTIVHPTDAAGDPACTDPGTTADEGEAALDAEWAGAAAPDANIVVAACADSSTTFGPFEAASRLLDQASPSPVPSSIWSLSYGSCEPEDGQGAQTANNLWSEAAAEGITVFVSSGDAGSTACDQNSGQPAELGPAVNGMASSPYNVAVGGTDFNDFYYVSNPNVANPYWSSSNSALYQSALSYIPEQTWNDTCASSEVDSVLNYPTTTAGAVAACNTAGILLAVGGAGGGASIYHWQPEWQLGIYGATNYQSRMLPDVSLFSSNGFYGHALVYCMSDATQKGNPCTYSNSDDVYFNSAGGTSFAAPAMAGVQALVNQAVGGSSGNMLPALYTIGTEEYGVNGAPNSSALNSCNSNNGTGIGATCVFNNVTVGNIDQPCFANTINCYNGSVTPEQYGVVMGNTGSSTTLVQAWNANAGYSMATGLGSVNVTNLVSAVATYDLSLPSARYVVPADFMDAYSVSNSDGFTDIALVNSTSGSFTGLAMKGNVVMQHTTMGISPGYSINAIGNLGLAKSGITSDTLAWTSNASHQLVVWLAATTGTANRYVVGNPYPAGWELIGAGSPNGPGVQSLFWFNPNTAQFGWWTLSINSSTGAPQVSNYSALMSVSSGYVPTLADVNGDGYTDIVWTSTSDNSVYVWVNNQHGGFTSQRIADHPAGFTLFGAGDVNGDGKTDLIWYNASSSQMAWWVMNGATVVSQQTRNVAAGYTMASIGDFNADGRADILWVGTKGDAYIWESTGSSFESLPVVYPDGSAYTIPSGAQVQANRMQGGYLLPNP